MSHAQIVEQMDAIAEFAELDDYFDKPVRIYSSGMQVRLAFSVATAVRPDILIVDEALAVGDAYFQHKCFDRIRKYRRDGTTLLFVSHDPGAVKSLCDRAILIEGGTVMKDGLPADVLDFYNAIIVPGISQEAMQNLLASKQAVRSGDGQMRILQAQWRVNGSETLALVAGTPAELNLVIEVHQPVDDYTIGLLVKDRVGNDIFGTNTFHMAHAMPKLEAGKRYTVNFRFPSINLGPSYYSLTLALHASNNHLAGNYDWWERAIAFQVVPAEKTSTIGVCHMAVHMDSINEAR
jgi:lipopolysaccharide transport system ATP-binding protein